jgi:hypothetical protein
MLQKWLSNNDLHLKGSNFFPDAKWITDAQISQTRKLRYEQYMGNPWRGREEPSNTKSLLFVTYATYKKMTCVSTYYHVAEMSHT